MISVVIIGSRTALRIGSFVSEPRPKHFKKRLSAML